MRKIVVYNSKTGYTKLYAQWISKKLNCDLKIAKNVKLEDLKKYDLIIYGGGLYAGGINGINLIKKNYEFLKDKKLIVFATGLSIGREAEIEKVWNLNFKDEQLNVIKRFYFRGGFNYKKLNLLDKILMSMLRLKIKSKKERSDDDKGILKSFEQPQNFCDIKNIDLLIQYVRNFK